MAGTNTSRYGLGVRTGLLAGAVGQIHLGCMGAWFLDWSRGLKLKPGNCASVPGVPSFLNYIRALPLSGSVRVQLFMPAYYDTAPPRASLPRRQRGPFALSSSLHARSLVSVCMSTTEHSRVCKRICKRPAFANGRLQSRASKRKRKRPIWKAALSKRSQRVYKRAFTKPR